MLRILPLALPALALAACGYVPLSSMPKLAQIDMATTDPAKFRAGFAGPGALRPAQSPSAMIVSVKVGDEALAIHRLALARVEDPVEVAALARQQPGDRGVYLFRLSPQDAEKLAAIRAEALARKSEGKRGELTIAISPNFCRSAELAPGPVLIDTYLRMSELADYVALTRSVDLRRVDGKDVAALIPPCDGATNANGKLDARRPLSGAQR